MDLHTLINNIQWGLMLDITVVDILQMLIMTAVVFYLCKTLYRTRAWVLMKGFAVIGIAYLLVYSTNMTVLKIIMDGVFNVLLIAIVIMFQPDLQRLVESVGKKSITSTVTGILKKQPEIDTWASDKSIYEIVSACEDMSKVKTGALIVIERAIPLKEYIESGISIKADISSQLLINIFEKNTPLHDGAVIIRNNKVAAATCYLPLTSNEKVDKHLGTRHRAAIGISEASDCLVIVVSEETGAMSICVDGKIQHNIDRSQLSQELHNFCLKKDNKVVKKKVHSTPMYIKVISPIISIFLCLFILNVDDPVIKRTFDNIPVEILNESVLLDKNQSYAIESGETVSVTIKGHRSTLQSLRTSDILATANMEELSLTYSVPINVSMLSYGDKVEIQPQANVLKVALENLSQVEIPVEIEVEGANASRLIAVDVENNKTLIVSGAESVVKTLDKAVVTIDISSRYTDFTQTCAAVIYDKNGEIVPESKLKMTNEIVVKGTAYKTKTVPIKAQLIEQDTNADTYFELVDLQTDVTHIKIAGDQEQLDKIETFDLTIIPDSETITSQIFKLKNYLPEGIYLAPGQEEEIVISVNLIKYQKVQVPITENDINIVQLTGKHLQIDIQEMPEYIECIIDTSKISENDLTIKMLSPSISTKDSAGTYNCTLSFSKIDGVEVKNPPMVTYQATEER